MFCLFVALSSISPPLLARAKVPPGPLAVPLKPTQPPKQAAAKPTHTPAQRPFSNL